MNKFKIDTYYEYRYSGELVIKVLGFIGKTTCIEIVEVNVNELDDVEYMRGSKHNWQLFDREWKESTIHNSELWRALNE